MGESIRDDHVHMLLDDLNIGQDNRSQLFELFDAEASGEVSVSDIVAVLLKVRGDVQKSDLIASREALRRLHEKFSEFSNSLLTNQAEMMANQARLMEASAIGSN